MNARGVKKAGMGVGVKNRLENKRGGGCRSMGVIYLDHLGTEAYGQHCCSLRDITAHTHSPLTAINKQPDIFTVGSPQRPFT